MHRVFAASTVILVLLILPISTRTLAATPIIDPSTLALNIDAFPAGAVITHRQVDRTAGAVDAEGVLGMTAKPGEFYHRLHFVGTVAERALLPRYNGAARAIWLMATVFPSSAAAIRAYEADSDFGNGCGASPAVAVSIPLQTCAYGDAKESGMYVIGTSGSVEFVVVGFVERGSHPALDQAIRDASYVARREVAHVTTVLTPHNVTRLATPSAQPTAAPTSTPTQGSLPVATQTPVDATHTPATATSQPTSRPLPLAPTSTPAATRRHRPVSANKRCPGVLQNKGWGRVSLRPDLYIGCVVNIAAYVGATQTEQSSVSYNANLNPDVGPDWFIFAHDYSDSPPSIPNNTWVRLQGVIQASTPGYNSSGSYVGNEPDIKVQRIVTISEREAKRMGADASK